MTTFVHAQAPAITAISAPRQVVTKGQDLTLSVTATGATSYQWKRSGRPIAGATNATYTITGAQPVRDNGWYQVVATNGSGSTTGATVFVSVAPAATQVIGWGLNDNGQTAVPAGLSDAMMIAAGYYSAGAVKANGSISQWGLVYSPPSDLGSVVGLAVSRLSYIHLVALRGDGTVASWGANGDGQTSVPGGLSGVVAISAGATHTIVLKVDGTLMAWGTTENGATAVPDGLAGVVAVSAGNNFNLALKSDGTVVGWGNNDSGQSTIPVGLNGVIAVGAGIAHSLALRADGTVVAWGYNGNGQTTVPPDLTDVVAISAGELHSVALKSDGTVVAWGESSAGQRVVPPGLNSVFAIAAGANHSLALRDTSGDIAPVISSQPNSLTAFAGQDVTLSVAASSGTALLNYQWRKGGQPISGATNSTLTLPRVIAGDAGNYDVVIANQLGTVTSNVATVTFNSTPAAGINGAARQLVNVGQSHTLASTVAIAGPLTYQWRRAGIAIPGATNSTFAITTASWRDAGAYQVLATNLSSSALSDPVWVVVAQPTIVVGYGLNSDTQNNPPLSLNNAVQIAAGELHSMAVTSAGTAVAWGDSGFGQRPAPVGLADVVQVAAGRYHSMALRADGTVTTWGQLNYTPSGLRNVIAIAGGENYAMALKFDGSIVAWNQSGVAMDVPAGLNAVAIAASPNFRMALKADGTVAVWYGESPPAGLANVRAISAGLSHALALKADGTVVAWGDPWQGPTNVPAGLNNVVAIAAGNYMSYALKADGSIVSWGNYDPATGAAVTRAGPALGLAATYHALVLHDSAGDTVPAITSQPTGGAVSFGGSKTFTVAANGGLLSYQWRLNGTAIDGATGPSYAISFAQPSHAGSYDVVVSNYLGSVTSSVATFAVGDLPAFYSHPSSQSVGFGGTVVLSYGAVGTSPITAQWRKNGAAIAGATNSALTLTNFQSDNAGDYTVALTNPVGTVVSNAATLTAVPSSPPVITSQPSSATLNPGNVGSFQVFVSSPYAVFYQWRKEGVPIPGATNYQYVIGPVQLANTGTYDVIVSDVRGSTTSASAYLTVNSPDLGITSGPVSAIMVVNSTVTFSVTASGLAPFSYQWRKNNVPIPGATSATLSIESVQLSDNGGYTVVVTNSAGSITSTLAALAVVSTAPIIFSQPVSSTILFGTNASFSVMAFGEPLTYQWRKNSLAIPGATNATLSMPGATVALAGQYDVVVTNPIGSSTSSTASLLVLQPPSFITQPVNATANVGQTVAFTAVATGGPSPTYQWQKNSVNLPGATNATLTLSNVQTSDAATYRVQISNSQGSLFSNAVTLTVNVLPVILTQPAGLALHAGTGGSLSVVASGTPTPTYQWRKAGVNIAGATGTSLPFANIQPSAAGDYDVVVTNAAGSVTSNIAALTVLTLPPTITTDPVAATLAVGSAYTLSVVASGSPTLTYQWKQNGVTLTGATASILTFPNVQTPARGDYLCVVTNPYGTVDSATVHLEVVPRPVTFSARLMIGGEAALGFFTVEGPASKTILLRAIGPGLAPFGLTGLLPDPQLDVFDSSGALVASNTDWDAASNAASVASTTAAVGAFALASGSNDSAILHSFTPGTYTVRATGASGATGLALLELFDTELVPGASKIPFVAVRGRVATGNSVLIGGLASNGRGVRNYLLRAIGPTLGLPGSLANPALLAVRDGTLVGNNDDWDAVTADGTAVTNASARVAAFQLPAGSKDAAVVLTGNLHNGPHTAQVNGPEGTSGVVLFEFHDLDATRPTTFAPYLVSPPVAQVINAGAPLTLRALAHGTGPLVYQWRKNGVNLAGGGESFAIPVATPSDGGAYTVVITNAFGSATSLPAIITVQSGAGSFAATHAALGGYIAGGTLTITNTLSFTGTPSSLGWTVSLPTGWSFASDSGASGDVKPLVDASGVIGWGWTNPPASPITFNYTLKVPPGETGDRILTASAIVRTTELAEPQTLSATPSPLTVIPSSRLHSADSSGDFHISLFELTRVIELYNTRNGTTRTGAYKVQEGTEDGFGVDVMRVNDATMTLARYHSADTRGATVGSPPDGKLSLVELTRVIELYNYRAGTVRTGDYHVQAGTEDGFAPGL